MVDDALQTTADDENNAGARDVEEEAAVSEESENVTLPTLVEVIDGVAVWFGEVPQGINLIDIDQFLTFDRVQLSKVLGSIGNVGTITGNIAEAVNHAQGLYRVNDATLSLLKSGGELAAKDGAKLGSIFKNGELVAQARFIPVSMTAAAVIAAIGPAVAMIALQMQLGEISGLVRTNIALTTQALKTIRSDQWAELTSLVKTVDGAIQEARELGKVNESVWELISHEASAITQKRDLYRANVDEHAKELGRLDGRARRQYLESNAAAIIFDTHALLSSLEMYAGYQSLRAARASVRSGNDESEAELFDNITQKTPPEIEESLREIGQLIEALVRELRIIAELPGRATMPLTKKRRDAKASQLTCVQLLDALEPLANTLQPAVDRPTIPDAVCAPENLDLNPYLNVLRWFLKEGEQLRGIAFSYEPGAHDVAGVMPIVLAQRVDAAWDALAPGRAGAIVEKLTSCTLVAVTDRRIVTARPKALIRHGELGDTYQLDEVKYVRTRDSHEKPVRPTIGVTTERRDVRWMFPADADLETIDNLASLIGEGSAGRTEVQAAIAPSRAGLSAP